MNITWNWLADLLANLNHSYQNWMVYFIAWVNESFPYLPPLFDMWLFCSLQLRDELLGGGTVLWYTTDTGGFESTFYLKDTVTYWRP